MRTTGVLANRLIPMQRLPRSLPRQMQHSSPSTITPASSATVGRFYVLSAALLWSTGGLIVRLLEAGTWTTVFWRSLTAFAVLFCYLLVRHGSSALRRSVDIGVPGLVIALCYTTASIALVVALGLTSVANTLVIMSATPLLAAVLGRLWLGERVRPASWFAIAASIAGFGLMVSDSYRSGTIAGDLVACTIVVAQAIAVVTIRKHHTTEMAPAMALATFIAVLIAFSLATTLLVSYRDFGLLTLFGAGQLGLGLLLYSFGAPMIPVIETALLNTLEPILGPLWVWLVIGERPSDMSLIGGAIVMASLAVHIVAGVDSKRMSS